MNKISSVFSRVVAVVVLLGSLLQSVSASAMIEGYMNSRDVQGKPSNLVSPLQRTHVIVLGTAEEFGETAFATARMKVLKWLEVAPQDQILILSADHKTGAKFLRENGFHVQEDVGSLLTNISLINRLAKQMRIASLEIYSHSNPPYGAVLDKTKDDLRYYLVYLKKYHAFYASLKKNFTPDAFAVFFGCNSAWNAAPTFSLLWGIPVAGSMHGTQFQVKGRDGQFRLATKSNVEKYGILRTDKVGYEQPQDCGKGCYRLRPDNANYNVYWGSFRAGLPFFKFFCVNPSDWDQVQDHWKKEYKKSTGKEWTEESGGVLDVENHEPLSQINISPERCLRSMAQFMIAEPSVRAISAKSDIMEIRDVVQDFLCPHTGDQARTDACKTGLYHAEMDASQEPVSLNFMDGNSKMAQCSLKGCMTRVVCKKDAPVPGQDVNVLPVYAQSSCQTVDLSPKLVTTLYDEYKNYLTGFSLLANESKVLPATVRMK